VDAARKVLADLPAGQRKLLITDGVFSMDGDLGALPALCTLAEEYGCIMMVDDAHASGVFGANGRGTIDHFAMHGRVDIQVGTLSKAIGALGGYVAGSKALIEFLYHRARPFLFSTSHPPSVAAACIAAIDVLEQEPQIIDRLWEKHALLQGRPEGTRLQHRPERKSDHAGDRGRRRAGDGSSRIGSFKRACSRRGFAFPTVARDKARVRTIVTATHTRDELQFALDVFGKVGRETRIGVTAPHRPSRLADFFDSYTRDLTAEDLQRLFTRDTRDAYKFLHPRPRRRRHAADAVAPPRRRRGAHPVPRVLDEAVAGAARRIRQRAAARARRSDRPVQRGRHHHHRPGADDRRHRRARSAVRGRHLVTVVRVRADEPAGAARGRRSAVAERTTSRSRATSSRAMLPSGLYTGVGVETVGMSRPANTVGGDFYDILPLDDGRLVITLGDVAGKGSPAALLMALLLAMLRTLVDEKLEPADLITRLNVQVCRHAPGSRFITLFYAGGSIRGPARSPTSAPATCRRCCCAATASCERLSDGGISLGMFEQSTYTTGHVVIQPEDSVRGLQRRHHRSGKSAGRAVR